MSSISSVRAANLARGLRRPRDDARSSDQSSLTAEVCMESLVTYLVAAMMAWVPLYAQPRSESPEASQAHYESIARDLASVVWDESEQPLFDGPDARAE